jgi:glycerophosphoryl diester phosphodiesterase
MAAGRLSKLAIVVAERAVNFSALKALAMKPEKWPAGAVTVPRIQAHRGLWKSKGLQENTLDSFHAAKNYRISMCECDLRLSKDQIPVVFHDENLSRLAETEEFVSELTAKELKEKAQVPTLREILLDPFCPRLWNLELKSKVIVDDPLERKVAQEIKLQGAEGRVLFSSFNPFSLMRIGLYLPHVPRALLVTSERSKDNHWLLRHMILAPLFSIHLLHLDQHMLGEGELELWKKKGFPVAVWTVNGQAEIEKYLNQGVVSVITDTPELFLRV